MRETHHNTADQVRGYLAGALALVEELNPPEDLRVAVFTKAADLATAKQIFIEPADQLAISQPAMTIPRTRH